MVKISKRAGKAAKAALKRNPKARNVPILNNLRNALWMNSKNLNTLARRKRLTISFGTNGKRVVKLKLNIGILAFDVESDGKVALNRVLSGTNPKAAKELGPYKASYQHPVADYFREEIERAINKWQ